MATPVSIERTRYNAASRRARKLIIEHAEAYELDSAAALKSWLRVIKAADTATGWASYLGANSAELKAAQELERQARASEGERAKRRTAWLEKQLADARLESVKAR